MRLCTRAPTRTRAPRRTRCAATPRPLCLPPRPLPTTHARKHPVHTKPSPRPSRRPPRAWPSLGVAPAATPAHAVPVPAARLRAAHCASPRPSQTHPAPVHTKPRHEAFCHPRLALARRRAGAHPCPCRAHVPAARSRVARLRGAPALARHPAGVPSQRASQPAAALRRPPAAPPALARRCAGARCPPRRDLACRPLSAGRSRTLARCTLARRPCPRTAPRRRAS